MNEWLDPQMFHADACDFCAAGKIMMTVNVLLFVAQLSRLPMQSV